MAATHFKKKMAREVKEMVEDRYLAREFLQNVANIKHDRRKRNIQALTANSTNPDKPEKDYLLANMEELYDEMAEEKFKKKLHDNQVKQ